MKTFVRGLILAAGMLAATGAFARSDIRDGNALVKPEKNERYSIDGATLGKAELYGYIGDLRDTDGITGIVLKRGGTDEQRKIIGSIARALKLKAFEQDGRELKSIDLPPEEAAPPPPVETQPAQTQPAEAAPAATEGQGSR